MNASQPVTTIRRVLTSLNCDGKYGVGLLLACAVLLLPELGGDVGRTLLRYDRAGLAAGQWWRLLTGHIVHLDLEHAGLNSLGLVLMLVFVPPRLQPPPMDPDRARDARDHRRRAVAPRFDSGLVRGFLRSPARCD